MGFNKGPLLGFKARGVGGFRGSRDADVEVCLLQNSPKEDGVYMSFHPRNHECDGGRPYFYHVRTSACAAVHVYNRVTSNTPSYFRFSLWHGP